MTPPRAAAPRVPLSRDRILRAAVELVDGEGLKAVSMRRLGEALGVEAMSLYNHVPNKAAVLDGVYEAILGELPAMRTSGSWQGDLRARARALRGVLRAHPNALALFATRPAVTTASLRHMEQALAVLRAAGFSAEDTLASFQILVAFVLGHTMMTTATAAAAADLSQPAYEQLSEAEFPRVREAARLPSRFDVEREFEFGLDVILAGINARARR